MNILFVGLLYNPNKEKEIIELSENGLSIASNLYQWNLINGLKSINDVNIEVLGSIPMGNFPKLSKKVFFYSDKELNSNFEYQEIGFINFFIFKHCYRELYIKNILRNG